MTDPAVSHNASGEVFISHRNTERDVALAHEICDGLERLGVSSWLDKERLSGGVSYKREITEAIRKSRAVIVIFDEEPSDWLVFEAGCAFFDHKLIPVSVAGAKLPEPYKGIQAVALPEEGAPEFDEKMEELLHLCRSRVRGEGAGGILLRVAGFVHGLFKSGLSVFYIAFAALLTFALGAVTDGGPNANTPLYDTLHHLHAVLGMLTLGGGLFIPMFLARAQASPSFRERQFGVKVALELFTIWIFIALLLPVIGGLMIVIPDRRHDFMTPWVNLSIMLYLVALLFWVIGVWLAQGSNAADRETDRRGFMIRSARASVAFLIAFAINVLVINLMLFRYGGG